MGPMGTVPKLDTSLRFRIPFRNVWKWNLGTFDLWLEVGFSQFRNGQTFSLCCQPRAWQPDVRPSKSSPWHVCLHGPAHWTPTGRRLRAFIRIFAFMGQFTLASHGAPSVLFLLPFSAPVFSCTLFEGLATRPGPAFLGSAVSPFFTSFLLALGLLGVPGDQAMEVLW